MLGLYSVMSGAGVSIAVDSYLWRRWLWPELQVLLFNTVSQWEQPGSPLPPDIPPRPDLPLLPQQVDNRSHEWGTSPPHWYITSALPRALGAALPLAVLGGLFDRRLLRVLLPAAAFVGLYSLLPHKELRFLFPCLPLFNVAAAAAMDQLWQGRRRSHLRRLAFLAAAAAVALTACVSALGLYASSLNYPGGEAMRALLPLLQPYAGAQVSVHIDGYAAMTGASRFLEAVDGTVIYSKEEGLSREQLLRDRRFDLLVTQDGRGPWPGYYQLAAVKGLSGLKLELGPLLRGPLTWFGSLVREVAEGRWQEVAAQLALVRLDRRPLVFILGRKTGTSS